MSPRGPRYAAELARFNPDFEVIFVDCVARGRESVLPSNSKAFRTSTSTHGTSRGVAEGDSR